MLAWGTGGRVIVTRIAEELFPASNFDGRSLTSFNDLREP